MLLHFLCFRRIFFYKKQQTSLLKFLKIILIYKFTGVFRTYRNNFVDILFYLRYNSPMHNIDKSDENFDIIQETLNQLNEKLASLLKQKKEN